MGALTMSIKPPAIFAIEPDDVAAEHVGRNHDGNQFFLTTPFEPSGPNGEGCEYVALYLFDPAGKLISANIESFGPRATLNKDARQSALDQMLDSLGDFGYCRIEIEPFSVERFGSQFGLIIREPEDEEDVIAIEAQPGNYMAFFEPWDSGEYDT
jgi:hypothetical protein